VDGLEPVVGATPVDGARVELRVDLEPFGHHGRGGDDLAGRARAKAA